MPSTDKVVSLSSRRASKRREARRARHEEALSAWASSKEGAALLTLILHDGKYPHFCHKAREARRAYQEASVAGDGVVALNDGGVLITAITAEVYCIYFANNSLNVSEWIKRAGYVSTCADCNRAADPTPPQTAPKRAEEVTDAPAEEVEG